MHIHSVALMAAVCKLARAGHYTLHDQASVGLHCVFL